MENTIPYKTTKSTVNMLKHNFLSLWSITIFRTRKVNLKRAFFVGISHCQPVTSVKTSWPCKSVLNESCSTLRPFLVYLTSPQGIIIRSKFKYISQTSLQRKQWIALVDMTNATFFSSFNPCPSLPSVATTFVQLTVPKIFSQFIKDYY